MSRIGFYTGLCWSASFILAMLSLTQPVWGFAGNLLGIASIWVAGWQLRVWQMKNTDKDHLWGVRQRWHKSLLVQMLAALLCTFVQYLYFRYMDNGEMMSILTELYSNPANVETLKQMVPEYDPKEVVTLLTQITLRDLTFNLLVVNAMLALVLSIPTAFVARYKAS